MDDEAPLVVVQEAPPEPPQEPVTVIVDASPTIITPEPEPETKSDDVLASLLSRLDDLAARLDGLESRRAEAEGPEVGPVPEPIAEETVVAPTEDIVPPPTKEPAKDGKRHAGFWI